MNPTMFGGDSPGPISRRAAQLFSDQVEDGYRRVDRIFAILLPFQWLAAVLVALLVSPNSWAGETGVVRSNVWASFYLGGAIVTLPIALAWLYPGRAITRQFMAISQMLIGTLLIHLSRGRIETHFHVFGSLALLTLYRDWRVLATATLVATLEYDFRGVCWPRFVFGVQPLSPWLWFEHAAWIFFDVAVLIFGCLQSLRAIRDVAHRKAELEATRDQSEKAVVGQTVESEGANETLRGEVAERRDAEVKALQAQRLSEAATRAKSEFLANMSHEIQTPMNGILGMTELVLETKLSPTRREYLDLTKRSADSLLEIINDILDSSKIEAGKLDLDETDFSLRDMLFNVLEPLGTLAHAKRLELFCDVDLEVADVRVGDAGRLRQVLINLVGNAVKFTKDGEIVLTVGRDTNPGARADSLQFSVSDTGIGIPDEKQQVVFDAFTQAEGSTSRKFGGTGLGLAVSLNLVKLMGGRLWVESRPGCGTQFHFTALLPSTIHPLATPLDAGPELKGLRILIVDDNASSLRTLEKFPVGWGMEPTLGNSSTLGQKAMSRAVAEGRPFSLILLDATIPEINGFDLVGRIYTNGSIMGATILMISSPDQFSNSAPSQKNGPCCLMKPVSQSELREAIKNSLTHTFSLVPIEPNPNPLEEAALIPSLRILLAEDNVVNQRLAVRFLEKQGHSVVVAGDGKQALDLLISGHFDLVIMDVQMPVMDGLEVATALRVHELQTGGQLPVIALTASAMESDRERCLLAGCDDFVTKPIRWPLLAVAIEAQTRSSSPIDANDFKESPPRTIFDLDSALEHVGGDLEILKEVAEMFLEECPQLFGQLADAVEEKDSKAIEFAAHRLRGAASTFASEAVTEVATRLERFGALGNVTAASEAFSPLPGIIDQLKRDLVHLIKS